MVGSFFVVSQQFFAALDAGGDACGVFGVTMGAANAQPGNKGFLIQMIDGFR